MVIKSSSVVFMSWLEMRFFTSGRLQPAHCDVQRDMVVHSQGYVPVLFAFSLFVQVLQYEAVVVFLGEFQFHGASCWVRQKISSRYWRTDFLQAFWDSD